MSFADIRSHAGTWVLYGLHLLIALSLPFVLALVIGCKKIEEQEADYGPEVAVADIDLALSKAINDATLSHTAVGQHVKYNLTRRLENEEVTTLLGGIQVEVINREDTATEAKFTLKVTKSERLTSNGEFEVKITEEPLILEKASLVAPNNAGELEAKEVSASERRVSRITYHKLREFTQVEAPPRAVRERAGCGGLDPCELELRYIRFDMVQWFEDGGHQKVSFDFAFSLQTPFLPFGDDFDQLNGLLVIDCRSTYVPIEGRTVYVRDCLNLEDFQN